MTLFIGVDPGFTGAIAFLDDVEGREYARVYDMPTREQGTRKRVDRDAVTALIREEMTASPGGIRLVAVVEAVASIGNKKTKKGEDRKEGTQSMLRFGQGQGEVLGIVTAMGALVFEIPPPTWKAKTGLIGVGEKDVCKRAWLMFKLPRETLFGPGGGAKHGRAEALFLAAYGRMLTEGRQIHDR